MTDPDKEMRAIKRKLQNARREVKKAVERFAEIDARRGHRIEALRRARAVRDEADRAVRFFESQHDGDDWTDPQGSGWRGD